MDPRPSPAPGEPGSDPAAPGRAGAARAFDPFVRRSRRRGRARRPGSLPAGHALADRLSGALILALVVFTPWAFGTTQPWALWTAHAGGIAVGALFLVQWLFRRRTGMLPSRWIDLPPEESPDGPETPEPIADPWIRFLGWATLALLGYAAVSALNARADFDAARHEFDYLREPFRWLPHSYDRGATLHTLVQWLGLAGLFWGTREWLLQRSPQDALAARDESAPLAIPGRLSLLLWVLSLNGAALAMVAILQRAGGTSALLWLVPSRSGKPPDAVFGPWSYRANAAQYFNLLWPVCLAFWVWTHERATRGVSSRFKRFDGPQLILLPCAIFLAACPAISGNRGGALIAIGMGGVATLILLFSHHLSSHVRSITVAGLGLAGLVSIASGWNAALARFNPPDSVFRTGLNPGTNDFTLLVRLQIPDRPSRRWRHLVSLSPDARAAAPAHRAHLTITPEGGFLFQFLGTSHTNRNDHFVPAPPLDIRGEVVNLAVVREHGIHLFVNGSELGDLESGTGLQPGWSGRILAEYLRVSSQMVSEVALLGFALSPRELRAFGGRPLAELEAAVQSPQHSSPDLAATVDRVMVPEGVVPEIASRPVDPSTRWLILRRAGTPGPLAFRALLDPTNLPYRGLLSASFQVWNPDNHPVSLAVSIDHGPASVVEVPARGVHPLRTPVRLPGGGAPATLQIARVEDDLGSPLVTPVDSQLFIRDLRADAGASVFIRPLPARSRLDPRALADRFSAYSETREAARRMAADFRIWGSGPGTFASLHQLYREPGQPWAAYAHDDWMETRVTLGWVGLALVVASLGALLGRSAFGPGLPMPRAIWALWWMALAGALLHARFDFPFQIHSVLFLFVLLASALTALTAAPRR